MENTHPSLAFLIVTEKGRLERQSRLLASSIRTFCGSMKNAPIYSFEPRTDEVSLSRETLQDFAKLGVMHQAMKLNTKYPDNGFANKPVVCTWAQENLDEDILVFLDSDQVFFNEPVELLKCDFYSVAIRQVHVKNIGVIDSSEENFHIWQKMYAMFDMKKARIVRTVQEGTPILAYYNSGIVAVKKASGICSQWLECYEYAMDSELYPTRHNVAYVEQVALAVAIEMKAEHVYILPRSYNFPFSGYNYLPDSEKLVRLEEMVSAHYHGCFDKWMEHFISLKGFCKSSPCMKWLLARLMRMGFQPTEGGEAGNILPVDDIIQALEEQDAS